MHLSLLYIYIYTSYYNSMQDIVTTLRKALNIFNFKCCSMHLDMIHPFTALHVAHTVLIVPIANPCAAVSALGSELEVAIIEKE